MSDYEDEMDVDAPPKGAIQFSSDSTAKGKRTAADLPVEAQDNLPWCEWKTSECRDGYLTYEIGSRNTVPIA